MVRDDMALFFTCIPVLLFTQYTLALPTRSGGCSMCGALLLTHSSKMPKDGTGPGQFSFSVCVCVWYEGGSLFAGLYLQKCGFSQ